MSLFDLFDYRSQGIISLDSINIFCPGCGTVTSELYKQYNSDWGDIVQFRLKCMKCDRHFLTINQKTDEELIKNELKELKKNISDYLFILSICQKPHYSIDDYQKCEEENDSTHPELDIGDHEHDFRDVGHNPTYGLAKQCYEEGVCKVTIFPNRR